MPLLDQLQSHSETSALTEPERPTRKKAWSFDADGHLVDPDGNVLYDDDELAEMEVEKAVAEADTDAPEIELVTPRKRTKRTYMLAHGHGADRVETPNYGLLQRDLSDLEHSITPDLLATTPTGSVPRDVALDLFGLCELLTIDVHTELREWATRTGKPSPELVQHHETGEDVGWGEFVEALDDAGWDAEQLEQGACERILGAAGDYDRQVQRGRWEALPEPVGEPAKTRHDPATDVIEGLVCEGEVFTASSGPGIGKTILSFALAESVTHGGCWLNHRTIARPFLAFNFEDTKTNAENIRYYTRERSGFNGEDEPLYVEMFAEPDSPKYVKEIVENAGTYTLADLVNYGCRILEHLRDSGHANAVIVIDNLRSLVAMAATEDVEHGGRPLDENSTSDLNYLISRLSPWRVIYGATIVLIHHFSKGGAGFSGASGLTSTSAAQVDIALIDTHAYADMDKHAILRKDVLLDMACEAIAEELKERENPRRKTVYGSYGEWPDIFLTRRESAAPRFAGQIPDKYIPSEVIPVRFERVRPSRQFPRFETFDAFQCRYFNADGEGEGVLYVRDVHGYMSHWPSLASGNSSDVATKARKKAMEAAAKRHFRDWSSDPPIDHEAEEALADSLKTAGVLDLLGAEIEENGGEPILLETSAARCDADIETIKRIVLESEGAYRLRSTKDGIVILKGD